MNKDLLNNKIVRELLGLIYSGQYESGSKLPAERTLSIELGVSRGTIREAMGALASMGVIEIRHGSGAYVCQIKHEAIPSSFLPPDFDNVSLTDILIARKAIETTVAKLACTHITKVQIKELATLIDCMEKSLDNLPMFLKYDMDFHYAIVRAAGNRPLEMAFGAIYEYHKYSVVFTSRNPGDENIALKFHIRMLNALKQRDEAAAMAAIGEHLDVMAETSAKPGRKNAGRKKL